MNSVLMLLLDLILCLNSSIMLSAVQAHNQGMVSAPKCGHQGGDTGQQFTTGRAKETERMAGLEGATAPVSTTLPSVGDEKHRR